MPPRTKKITTPNVIARMSLSNPKQSSEYAVQTGLLRRFTLSALALVLLAGVSVGAFAQTARAGEQPACDGFFSCIQSFGQGLWATITFTPPQKTSATAAERISDPPAEATYGSKHPLVLQPKEGDFVGIGVDNPQAKLQISGGSTDTLADAPAGIYIDEFKNKSSEEDVAKGAPLYTYWPRMVLKSELGTPYLDFWSTGWKRERINDKGEKVTIPDPHATLAFNPVEGAFQVNTRFDVLGSGLFVFAKREQAGPQPLLKLQSNEGGTAALDIGDGYQGRYWRVAVDNNSPENSGFERERLRIQPVSSTPDKVEYDADSASYDSGITIRRNGYVGIRNQKPEYFLDVNGNSRIQGFFYATEDVVVGKKSASLDASQRFALANDRIGLDVAEIYKTEEDVEVGDVLVVADSERTLQKSTKQYEDDIIGVVSGAPALLFEGSELKIGAKPDRFTKGSRPPVALAGRVPVKVSLENGPIRVGDYLTSSSKLGVAMRATDPGMTLGIALENYSGGDDGKVLTFINIGEKNVAKKLKDLEKEIAELKSRIKK